MNLQQDRLRLRSAVISRLRHPYGLIPTVIFCLLVATMPSAVLAAINGVDGANWSLMNADLPSLAFSTGFGVNNFGIGIRENRDVYQTFKITSAETSGAPAIAINAFWVGYDSSGGAASPGEDRAFILRLFEIPNALTAAGTSPIGGVEIWNSGLTSTQTLGNGIRPAPGFGGVVSIDVSTRQIQLSKGKDYAFQIDDDGHAAPETLAWKAPTGNYANGVMVSGGTPQSAPGDVELGITGSPIVPEPSTIALFISGLVFFSTLLRIQPN